MNLWSLTVKVAIEYTESIGGFIVTGNCPVELSKQDAWYPSDDELSKLEELGYYGIHDPKQICLIMNIEPKQLAWASLFGEALKAHQRGQAKAHLSLTQTIMDMATGVLAPNPVQFSTARYMLQARFNYDESSAVTKSRENMESKKIRLTKKMHRDNLDLQTTKLINSLNEDDLLKVTNKG